MDKQHTKLIDSVKLESENEQGSLVCCNTKSIPCSFLDLEKLIINPKKINIFTNLAVSLKRIHTRLLMEGYIIKNGKIYKPK